MSRGESGTGLRYGWGENLKCMTAESGCRFVFISRKISFSG